MNSDEFNQISEKEYLPVKVGFAAYFKEIERVGLIEEFESQGDHIVFISGKEVRKTLQDGRPVDECIMRKPVVDILTKYYAGNEN